MEKDVWTLWSRPFSWDAESIDWLNNRPKKIIQLMLLFPPDTKVRATKPLMCPRPNEIGIVSSWFDSGLISVTVPGKDLKAQCKPEWLEVLEFRQGLFPEDIKENLVGWK